MTRALLAALVFSSVAQAEVIECPQYYPAAATTLPSSASDSKGTVQLRRSHLSFARIYTGELYGEQMFTPPASNKVKGGWDATYDVDAQGGNWLICRYGGAEWGTGVVDRWEKLKVTSKECVLQVRQNTVRHAGTRWTAAADCK